jgi:hypothetical protein
MIPPLTDADREIFDLLMACRDTLWLLSEPVYPDEKPSDAAIVRLCERVDALLIARLGPDPGYATALRDRFLP